MIAAVARLLLLAAAVARRCCYCSLVAARMIAGRLCPIAQMLDMPPIRVYEVATFYSMYNREPMAKYHLQVCGTTPCQLCGSEKILDTLSKALGVAPGEHTKDGMFVFTEVECLGACANAPMLQLNNHEFYEVRRNWLTHAQTGGVAPRCAIAVLAVRRRPAVLLVAVAAGIAKEAPC
jgi:hypothetical protein